jgi:hypothetical protein
MRKSVVFLLALGLLQMAGDVLRLPAIKALAAATAASPAPKSSPRCADWRLTLPAFFLSGRIAPDTSSRWRLPPRGHAGCAVHTTAATCMGLYLHMGQSCSLTLLFNLCSSRYHTTRYAVTLHYCRSWELIRPIYKARRGCAWRHALAPKSARCR